MDDGAFAIRLAGADVVLRVSGALWLPGERMLVVADLHLEKGSAYAARGQLLPPYDTRETLNRLEREVATLAPRSVVLLGDTLHDHGASTRIASDERARLAALAEGVRLIWIAGNHDPEGAGDLGGETAERVEVAGLSLCHEPSPGPVDGEVSGHLHPCARVSGAAGSVRRRCFASDGSRLILPAFGAYAGGLNLRDPAFGGLFRAPPTGYLLARRVSAISYDKIRPDHWSSAG
jgi:DNA ligase-associated metallophosphoesterase